MDCRSVRASTVPLGVLFTFEDRVCWRCYGNQTIDLLTNDDGVKCIIAREVDDVDECNIVVLPAETHVFIEKDSLET